MTCPIEEQLTDVLSSQATQVRDVPDLGTRVVARGRAVRRRRRGISAAVGAGLVAVGALAGMNGGTTQQTVRPAERTPAVTPSPSVTADDLPGPIEASPQEVERWLSSLPAGAPPDGTYEDAQRRIIIGGAAVASSAEGPSVFFMERTVAGVLVLVHTGGFTGAEDPGAWVTLLRPDGSARRLAQGQLDGYAVAPDGRTIALSVSRPAPHPQSAYGWPGKLLVIDARTGKVTASLQRRVPAFVAGWVAGRVAWWETNPDGSGAEEIWTWSPGTRPQRFADGRLLQAAGRRLVMTPPDRECGQVVDLDQPAVVVGDGCAAYGRSLSPDGRWFVRDDLSFQDLATRRVVDPGAPATSVGSWESSTSLLLTASVARGADALPSRTLVRCRVTDGRCERIPALTRPKERKIRLE